MAGGPEGDASSRVGEDFVRSPRQGLTRRSVRGSARIRQVTLLDYEGARDRAVSDVKLDLETLKA